ncbi:membrane protein, partial [Streptomyces platensis subsp. clarensis]|nr:membrane protein [Streptomyces platensis subsp. clarensis]
LGAFSVGLVGWVAFLAMMVVLGLLVLTLMAYNEGLTGDAQGNAENTPNGAPPVAPTSA